ncbi:MAG TPA: ABC transporter permease [Acetobacteraceae bacterium]|jgi:ribose transport system permease protein|nr:ABC transporter permease [Acetobacteraceae bacterium]
MSERVLSRPAEEESRASLLAEIQHRLPLETYVLALTVLLWIILGLVSPYFWTEGNITNILRQVSIDAILAFGSLFPITLAGIDLSVGSVAGLSGVVFSMLIADLGVGLLPAFAATLAMGLAIGVINGWAIDRLGIPPFIVTLAGLQGYRGLALLLSGGMTIAGMPAGLQSFSLSSVAHIPTLFLLMTAIGLCAHFLLAYTRLGRYMYAIGSNPEAARRVGIRVIHVTTIAYALAALFATISGLLLVARLSMGSPTAATGSELEAIAAAVVGGASLFGGRGTILGCFIGALLFTTLGNGANLLGINSFWQMVIEGLLIAFVVYFDNLQKRRQVGMG